MPEPASTNVKQTPGRRRPGPNAVRSATRKNYSSENDAASADPNVRPDFAQRRQSPQTPKKGTSKSSAPNTQSSTNGKSNRRNGNKNYPKNISTSPAPAQPGRRTPPQSAGSKSSGAFAGATFHASPAPSSLPLPSFFTKTTSPDTPRAVTATSPCQELSPPASDTEALPGRGRNGLSKASVAPHESPLDIFFRADRAEKDRAHRPASANIYNGHMPPYSPPTRKQAVPDEACNTYPRIAQQALRRPVHLRNQSSGISAAELNGNPHPNQSIGPAFAASFQERMRAVRPPEPNGPAARGSAGFRDPAAPPISPPDLSPGHGTDDRSEALKRYLFSKTATTTTTSTLGPPIGVPTSGPVLTHASGPATSTRHVRGQSIGSSAPQSTGFAPSAFQNIYSSTPTTVSGNNEAANIAAMEDSLRQLLNLGSSSPFKTGPSQAGYTRRN